jgi:hypothetical protein
MHPGTGFFIEHEGARGERSTVTNDKMVIITRNCNTDYLSLLNMTYGQIDMLYYTLVELIEEENKAKEEALKNRG